jgi:quercetin dioxygenase-like cupin family protein
VLEGEVRYRVGDQERWAKVGETLLAPKGIPHTYRVETAEARMLTITRGEFENFIRLLATLTEEQRLFRP